jgi:hypothetical protein
MSWPMCLPRCTPILRKVVLAERNQRDALITGIELSLYISNWLSVYLDVYGHLSPSLAANNSRAALTRLYVQMFCFIAHAVRIRRMRSIGRAVQALWDSNILMQLEEECDELCASLSEEARICDSQVNLEGQLQNLSEIRAVHASVLRIHEKVDFGKLRTAGEATHNLSAEGELPRCLPDTRTDLLKQIAGWAGDPTGKRIFWLCARAGTGKSTISRTVAHDDNLLGASFFFKRGRAETSHAKIFFPTIARKLADFFPAIAPGIAASLDQDSLLCD